MKKKRNNEEGCPESAVLKTWRFSLYFPIHSSWHGPHRCRRWGWLQVRVGNNMGGKSSVYIITPSVRGNSFG